MKKIICGLLFLAVQAFAAHDGTIVGSPTIAAAKFSNGLTATDDGGYISLPTGVFPYGISDSWTVEAWVKSPGTSTVVFASFGTTNPVWLGAVSGNFAGSVTGSGSYAAAMSSGININDGSYHHVAMVMTSGTAVKLFVDGVSGGGPFTGVMTAPSTTDGDIGRFTFTTGFFWPGAIDEVVIWGSAKYTVTFTPPVSQYAGTESNMFALYHLESRVDSIVSATPILMNDAAIVYSPYNWNVSSSWAKTINSGAYFRVICTSTTAISITTDTSANSSPYSQFWVRIDNQGWTQKTLTAGNPTVLIQSGLASRNHLLEVLIKSTSINLARWSSSATMVTFTGILLDSGGVAAAPRTRTKNILIYGDSITEGVRTKDNTATNDTDQDDILGDYAYALATAVDAEVGIVGFGGQGVTVGGVGSVPAFPSAYNLIYSGVSRSFTVPAPDLVIYNQGTNDSSSIVSGMETVINAIIALAPSSKHLILVPFNGTHSSEIATIVSDISSSKVTSQSTTGWFTTSDSTDAVHPYDYSHVGLIAPRLFPVVASLLATGTTQSGAVY